jgi:hypothetical protein
MFLLGAKLAGQLRRMLVCTSAQLWLMPDALASGGGGSGATSLPAAPQCSHCNQSSADGIDNKSGGSKSDAKTDAAPPTTSTAAAATSTTTTRAGATECILIAQVHAPRPRCYRRMLYVFACPTPACFQSRNG